MSDVSKDSDIAITEAIGSDSSNVPQNNVVENAKTGSSSLHNVVEPDPFEAWVKLDSDTIDAEDLNILNVDMNGDYSSSVNMLGTEKSTNPFSDEFFSSQVGNGDSENNLFMVSDEKPAGNQLFIDTNAPFDSVKGEVSKYGGIVDWKAHKARTEERLKQVQEELEITSKEIPKCKEQSEAAETDKNKVLQELDTTKALVEELKHNLEKAETEEVQLKQDSEFANLRMKEVKQGIANSASVAAKAELEVAKERHTTAIEELTLVKQEVEDVKKDYDSLVIEKDEAIRRSEDSISASNQIEKTVEDLTLELIASKELLDMVQSVHMEAEVHGIDPTLELEQETLNCETELAKAQAELQHLNEQHLLINDLSVKCDEASATLASLKAELDSHLARKLNQNAHLSDSIEMDMQTNTLQMLTTSRKELEDVKVKIEKSKHEVNSLKAAALSLKSEIDTEKESLETMRQKEGLELTSPSSLEAELSQMNTELEQILTREKEYREKMLELWNLLEQATEEADQAKAIVDLAQEELKKAKEDAEQANAEVSTMDTKLQATVKEIEAANFSSKIANATVKALEESDQKCSESDSPSGIKLSAEEYYSVNKKAHEAEELATEKVICAAEEIKTAKESESVCLVQLEEANEKLEEKKTELKLATDIAEKAQDGKLEVEQELRNWRGEQEQRRKNNDEVQNLSDINNINDGSSKHSSSSFKLKFPRISSFTGSSSDSKQGKRSFFPRIVMFLARKKAQTLK